MANTYLKAQQIVEVAQLILKREIVLPRLVWTDLTKQNFVGALNDTVTMKAPALRTAQRRTLRSNTPLTATDRSDTSVDVKLTDHVYDLLKISDEELTLDITNFARQILNPQMRAVAEGLEDIIADALAAAPVTANQQITLTAGTDEPYDVAVDADAILNGFNVPRSERVLVVGTNAQAAFLKSDKLSKVNESGDDSALRDATITRVANFRVVGSNAIDPNAAYAFHRTAIAFAAFAPTLPDGASMKAAVNQDGFGLRFLRDYAPENATGPVDRSLVDSFVGAASVNDDLADLDADTQVDDPYNRRIVKITVA